MGFDLKDIQNWIEDVSETIRGGKPGQVGNQNIQDAIVNPGKILSEFSGITQGVKGASPGSSKLDKGLALLTLVGLLGGQEAAMGLKGALSPDYVYGLHLMEGKNVPKKIKSIADAESRYGSKATPNMNAFFGFGSDPSSIPDKALDSVLRWGERYYDGSAAVVKTPKKHLSKDARSSVGWKTPKDLKVVKSVPYTMVKNSPEFDEGFFDPEMGDVLLDKNLLKKLINLQKKK